MGIFYYLLIVMLVLITSNFLVTMERMILGSIQLRMGPNKSVGGGVVQSVFDGWKLVFKFIIHPLDVNDYYYFYSPVFMIFMSLIIWVLFPYGGGYVDFCLGGVYYVVLLSLGVFPFIISGWSCNSSYSLLGCIRSVVQTISYEISFVVFMVCIIFLVGSFNFKKIILMQSSVSFLFMLGPIVFILIINMLSELNRTPFDLCEGESELVSGFNVEYSGILFTFIFLGEYISILSMGSFMVLFLFGLDISYLFFFCSMWVYFFIIFIRGVLPRFRYDDLMMLAWKKNLPSVLFLFILIFYFKGLICVH